MVPDSQKTHHSFRQDNSLTMKVVSAMLLALLLAATPFQQDETARVVLISIDGLMPRDHADPGRAPTLHRLANDGLAADGAISVFPSLTFAAHTTLITGVEPAVHGILDNRMFDPEGRSNDAWYWYARDIKVPTLPQVAKTRGLRVASIWWPATVGLEADVLVPEFWRSMHPETVSLLRALSSPRRLFDDVESARRQTFRIPITDRDKTDLALHALRTIDPHLLMLHLGDLDAARHEHGPDSPAARDALHRDDGYVADILNALASSGRKDRTTLAIVSDHGFLPLQTTLQPNAAFKEAGLLKVNDRGAVVDWQAYFHSSGGSGFVYVKDASAAERVAVILDQLQSDPRNGILHVFSRQQFSRRAHPDAAFAISMRKTFYTGGGHDVLLKPESLKGGHGFEPDRLEMLAALIFSGAEVERRGSLGVVSTSSVAATLGRILGVQLPEPAAPPLSLSRN
jgi:predicted AlkP superfamily pyrophosphatase or phosphodiesterase